MFCSFSVEPKNKISFNAPSYAAFTPAFHNMNSQNNVQNNLFQNNTLIGNHGINNNSYHSILNDQAFQSLPNVPTTVHHITGGTKKRKWTSEEDYLLIQAVNTYGVDNWNLVSQHIENRSGKQCRERWMSNMCPSLIKENWTYQEDLILIQKQSELGNKWTLIHTFLPGRSNTAIKNRWKCLCRRRASNHVQEFKQVYNVTPNKVAISQNTEIPRVSSSESVLPNVQQQAKPQKLTHDLIDSLFDGICWNEIESSLSIKI